MIAKVFDISAIRHITTGVVVSALLGAAGYILVVDRLQHRVETNEVTLLEVRAEAAVERQNRANLEKAVVGLTVEVRNLTAAVDKLETRLYGRRTE